MVTSEACIESNVLTFGAQTHLKLPELQSMEPV